MNQSSNLQNSVLASATEDEIIVSQILLDLRTLLSLTESLSDFNWGRTRRRSCYDASVPPLPPAPSCPSPSENEIEERRPLTHTAEEKGAAAARTTASPDTPLSFSPSESDEKSKHSSMKTSKKRSREDYIDMIEGLTQRKDLLRGEIENVKKYYNKLKAYNSELKAMKQEVLNTRREESQMEISRGMNLGTQLTQHYRINLAPHQQPLVADPTVHKFQDLVGPITSKLHPTNNGPASVNRAGPLGIDLNMPADEDLFGEPSQPLDVNIVIGDQRSRFAEARRRRRVIIKNKSTRVIKNCQQTDNNETLVL